eukprot:1524730-Rhodomonas_salina.3
MPSSSTQHGHGHRALPAERPLATQRRALLAVRKRNGSESQALGVARSAQTSDEPQIILLLTSTGGAPAPHFPYSDSRREVAKPNAIVGGLAQY